MKVDEQDCENAVRAVGHAEWALNQACEIEDSQEMDECSGFSFKDEDVDKSAEQEGGGAIADPGAIADRTPPSGAVPTFIEIHARRDSGQIKCSISIQTNEVNLVSTMNNHGVTFDFRRPTSRGYWHFYTSIGTFATTLHMLR